MMVAFVAAVSIFQRFPEEADAVVAPVAALFASEEGAASGRAMHDELSAHFTFCHSGGGSNCVVDGDTFWFAGEKYRIADIDTPETHPARCAEEAALGGAATERLQQWLNEGAFSLESAGRDSDRYGRKLRIVTRDGDSVGLLLIGEGLARSWEGRRRPWCAGSS
ncbi:thermonuclease family protein [Sphingopyxis sp. H115]|uniref:thermonuclease family protein n=1 Tax=Sphingopyxis sp. H115 TaxID=1759073 RepID=UPI0019101551|nr:thermonuclease family protein [Sphingopyxis sp. H115]